MESPAQSTKEVEESAPTKPPNDFIEFRKPILVGKIGKFPRKIVVNTPKDETETLPSISNVSQNIPEEEIEIDSNQSATILLKEKSIPLPYKEPKWSGLPPQEAGYGLEVLKSGCIVQTINLTNKPFHSFGRLSSNDVVMEHPTISRYHAVFQYKAEITEDNRCMGFYIYDLGSAHGTFINKVRIKPKCYVFIPVGQFIRLGCSTRRFILLGPQDDRDEESELSITEMKIMKEQERKNAEQTRLLLQTQQEEAAKKVEEEGISWGMAEDAEEETDLSVNPYAQSTNEELYLDDPKKTLRGYMEREGIPLEYDCQERGVGQFVCRVKLPIEDARGNPVIAEVVHKGKKKDTVVQCALEACRIIDMHGLLRQAKHESRKRKTKDWKEDDYYDSDDDNFLDRTGTVEKKRASRMSKHSGQLPTSTGPLTYTQLVSSCSSLEAEIQECEQRLARLREGFPTPAQDQATLAGGEDALDLFMSSLGKQHSSVANKADISKTKMELQKLKTELSKKQQLAEIAKPADLPALIRQEEPKPELQNPSVKRAPNSVIIGKRHRPKSSQPAPLEPQKAVAEEKEFTEEVDSEEDDAKQPTADLTPKKGDNLDKARKEVRSDSKLEDVKMDTEERKRTFGPMRPPKNYVVSDHYFQQITDRDLPEITEDDSY